jgi:hypothetical protein
MGFKQCFKCSIIAFIVKQKYTIYNNDGQITLLV